MRAPLVISKEKSWWRIHSDQCSLQLFTFQIFDYAIGHWFQKPAEHVMGSVMCCPGCFSVFRCKAINDVLPIYSTEVSHRVIGCAPRVICFAQSWSEWGGVGWGGGSGGEEWICGW